MSNRLFLSLLAASLLSACSDATDELVCAEDGRCDVPDSEVPVTPCDGIMVDKSGAGNQKVAGRLNDPLARLAFRIGKTCPTSFEAIIRKVGLNDSKCSKDEPGIQTRVVSETAQATGKPAASYRLVTSHNCGPRPEHSILFSLFGVRPGAELPKKVEIIAFDQSAGVFNYYETDGARINFFGNSRDLALKGPDANGDRACAKCHTGGGLVMKELDTPWMHWEGHVDVPGSDEIVKAHPLQLGEKASGSNMEDVVKAGNREWNTARLATLRKPVDGKVDTKELLRPLFCSVELNLDNGAEFESPIGGGADLTEGSPMTQVFAEVLLDPKLDNGEFIVIAPNDYDAVIKQNGQRVEGVTGAIDTIMDFAYIERSHADDDFVDKLQEAKVVDEDLVKDVLMVDFTRPVFSTDRCDLLRFAPTVTGAVTPAAIRAGLIANLEAAAPATGSPAATLLGHLKNAQDITTHHERVSTFVAACRKLGSRPFLQNLLAVVSRDRNLARERPVFEFQATMPIDNQQVDRAARLHPQTCQLVTTFVP